LAKGKNSIYEIRDGKLNRTRRTCPKCGPSVFLAKHKNRVSCGKCGYAEFEKK
jgi:small subunit ribosomal protein S27Ae